MLSADSGAVSQGPQATLRWLLCGSKAREAVREGPEEVGRNFQVTAPMVPRPVSEPGAFTEVGRATVVGGKALEGEMAACP